MNTKPLNSLGFLLVPMLAVFLLPTANAFASILVPIASEEYESEAAFSLTSSSETSCADEGYNELVELQLDDFILPSDFSTGSELPVRVHTVSIAAIPNSGTTTCLQRPFSWLTVFEVLIPSDPLLDGLIEPPRFLASECAYS